MCNGKHRPFEMLSTATNTTWIGLCLSCCPASQSSACPTSWTRLNTTYQVRDLTVTGAEPLLRLLAAHPADVEPPLGGSRAPKRTSPDITPAGLINLDNFRSLHDALRCIPPTVPFSCPVYQKRKVTPTT